MRRSPLSAIKAAVRSFIAHKPKKRTVQIPTPALPGEGENRARLRKHSKHSAASLPHRQHWRPARRAALSLRWSRVMADMPHPLARKANEAPEAIRAKGKDAARRWARGQLKVQRRAVAS